MSKSQLRNCRANETQCRICKWSWSYFLQSLRLRFSPSEKNSISTKRNWRFLCLGFPLSITMGKMLTFFLCNLTRNSLSAFLLQFVKFRFCRLARFEYYPLRNKKNLKSYNASFSYLSASSSCLIFGPGFQPVFL